MESVLALILTAITLLAAALSSSHTGHSAQHRAGASVADIRARLEAERDRSPFRRW